MRLKKWKDPTLSKSTQNSFSDVVYEVLKERGWSADQSGCLTVYQVNKYLDKLAQYKDRYKLTKSVFN